jgi:hypothetical protein
LRSGILNNIATRKHFILGEHFSMVWFILQQCYKILWLREEILEYALSIKQILLSLWCFGCKLIFMYYVCFIFNVVTTTTVAGPEHMGARKSVVHCWYLKHQNLCGLYQYVHGKCEEVGRLNSLVM